MVLSSPRGKKVNKVVIEFLRYADVYHPGDIAGFDEDIAKVYIENGTARIYEPESKGTPKRKKIDSDWSEDLAVNK